MNHLSPPHNSTAAVTSTISINTTPTDEAEFATLCEALQRNDPSIKCISTKRCLLADGYGYRLGQALQGNTVVAEIDLNLCYFLSQSECNSRVRRLYATDRTNREQILNQFKRWIQQQAEPLKQWIRSLSTTTILTNSLRTIRISTIAEEPIRQRSRNFELELQQGILEAMTSNPNTIRGFESTLYNFPIQLYTSYLTSNDMLQSLNFQVPENTSLEETEAVADAIGALVGLECLVIQLQHSIPLLQRLQKPSVPIAKCASASVLRELTIKFCYQYVDESHATLLSNIFRDSPELKEVGLEDVGISRNVWTILASGLQSNLAIDTFKLDSVEFATEQVAMLFLQSLQTTGMLSHIQSLQLKNCTLRSDATVGSAIVHMLCHSQIRHLTIDFHSLLRQGVSDFFDDLIAAGAAAMPLRSLRFDDILDEQWPHIERYLVTTTHLERLVMELDLSDRFDDNLPILPTSFLSSLRANGSLHHVQLMDRDELWYPTDAVLRFLDAITTRNRALPQLMSNISFDNRTDDDDDDIDDNGEMNDVLPHDGQLQQSLPQPLPTPTLSNLLPTLCEASSPAQRMTPNTLLRGLFASSDGLG